MGNRRGRELRLQQEQDASLEKLRTEPRPALADAHAFGIGTLRIQAWACPSFERARYWEVRQLEHEWLLYASEVVQQLPELTVVGFEKTPFDSTQLRDYFQSLTSLSLPLKPDLSGTEGLDGTRFGLGILGDLSSQIRFEWWSQFPPQWEPMIQIADQMLKEFVKAYESAP